MEKKSLGKEILSKTILFIAIVLFITIFKFIFGDENAPVGITIVVALLILLSHDLTKEPFKNFSVLLIVNLATGVAAFLAASNMWLGIIVNFLSLSLIGYYFGYNLTKALILPYGLQYLFMLNGPVYGGLFIKRIAALLFGAVIIMISQFIVNGKGKNTLNKANDIIVFEKDKSDSIYKDYYILGIKVRLHTVRASYAMRIGILTAVTSFITQYFNLTEGKWMVYTVFSLTEFYSENCKVRARKRLEGTLIGAIIVVCLFMFIKSMGIRGLIILIVGYLNPFAEDYRNTTILVTISAVASVALTNGTIFAAINRIAYVIIGTILALMANEIIINKPKKVI